MGIAVDAPNKGNNGSMAEKKPTVVFVLGGPGSGKGTQCANIAKHFGYTHLSSGDLLRAETRSGSENGTMIRNMMKEGKIVSAKVTIKLLLRAMAESCNDKFLLDGFPRDEESRAAFEDVTKIEPAFVLFFECSEEEMERRLLGRNQGREDDNIETIRKRFKVFSESSLPVIEHYKSRGKVRTIDAGRPIEEVFESVKAFFISKNEPWFARKFRTRQIDKLGSQNKFLLSLSISVSTLQMGQPESIAEDIESMVPSYVEKPNSIILAISPANQNIATSDAIKLARELDPNGNWTFGVMMKLDLMDKGTNALDDLRRFPTLQAEIAVAANES